MAKNKKWKRSQNTVLEKIHGRWARDKKGDIKKDKLGKKIRQGFGQFFQKVESISHRPWLGKHSDMNEMKAHRFEANKKRLEKLNKVGI